MIRARFFIVDRDQDLLLSLRPLGFPTAAAQFLSGTMAQGHLLLSGLGTEAADLVRHFCGGQHGMPRMVEGDRPGAFLLSGRLGELKHLGMQLQKRQEVPGAYEAGGKLQVACFHTARHEPVAIGKLWAGGGRSLIMGIVNVTPDSFSDGGRFQGVDAAVARAHALVEAGADLLDIGGESTRPKGPYGEGANPVSLEEERERVAPVIRAIARSLPEVALSIDTSRAEIAELAIQEGAVLVNDVRGLKDDALAEVVRKNHVACSVMHMPAEPDVMAEHTDYEDLIGEVADALNGLVAHAQARGISPQRLIVDPGFGFGKTADQNLFLLRQMPLLRASVGRPILVGTSRKGFLGKVTGKAVPERDPATAASLVAAILGGASVVRVHDVAACRDAAAVADAVATAESGGDWLAKEDDGWD